MMHVKSSFTLLWSLTHRRYVRALGRYRVQVRLRDADVAMWDELGDTVISIGDWKVMEVGLGARSLDFSRSV